MTQTIHLKVIGDQTIHCAACEQRIDRALRRLPGVGHVRASVDTQEVEVAIDPDQVGPEQVQARLEQLGHEVTSAGGAT